VIAAKGAKLHYEGDHMIQKMRKYQGQSTLEYAILVVIIIAALLSLQVYIKRGFQGRLRKSADDVGDQFSTAGDAKYNKTVTSHSVSHESNVKGEVETNTDNGASTNTETHVTLPSKSTEFN
jgi:hypothetical protein